MISKKPRESSMVLHTDLDEDEDYYEEDEDNAREIGKKQDEGNYKYVMIFTLIVIFRSINDL